jgi:hypothetical protein
LLSLCLEAISRVASADADDGSMERKTDVD